MAPKRLPARTVDLSQEHKYLPPPNPKPVRSQIATLVRLLARESGFVLLVLVLFTISLSISHSLHRWNQRPAGTDSPQRIVWSTVFERKPSTQAQPAAEAQQVASQALTPAAASQPLVRKASVQRTRPVQSQPQARRLSAPKVSYTGQQQRQGPQARARTVSPTVQPIQQILHKDYGRQADKPYSYYMNWVDNTLADYQRQRP